MTRKVSVEHLKDREKYRRTKYDYKGREMKGYEEVKLKNNLQDEIKQSEALRTIASVLLLAFVLGVILHLMGAF